MASVSRIQRTRIVVAVLAGYVMLQFVWWAISLQRFNTQLREAHSGQGPSLTPEQAEAEYTQRLWMIFGEGSVFFLLLLGGMALLLRYLRREGAFQNRQSEFLAMFTHELKSPIASIRLALQTLSRDRAKPEARAALYEAAEEETRRLEGLTDKILQSSRLSLEKHLWAQAPVDLSALCNDALARIRLRPDGAAFAGQVDAEVWVKGDAVALDSVVTNLMENALLHTPPGTPRGLTLTTREGLCTLEVFDHGTGVPDADKAKIFRRFVRRAPEGVRPQKGSGLGLFLVRGLVELHGGTLRLEDNSPSGARFIIHLQTLNHG